jgi:succinate dehydrogenase/fumarate reductase flavoprotein subunit
MASNGEIEQSTVDVVVVGFGAAGIAAAISAHDEGAEVVVLEKAAERDAGGNTRVAGQVWFTPRDAESAKRYLSDAAGEMPVDEDVADAWAEETTHNTEWLEARAAEASGHIDVDPTDPGGQDLEATAFSYAEAAAQYADEPIGGEEQAEIAGPVGGEDVPRDEFPEFDNSCGTDWIFFGGRQGWSRLWLRIKAALETREIEVRYGTGARQLIRDGAGRVVGVLADSPDGPERILARRGVVLAAGGFENNAAMIRKYLATPFATPWGSPLNTGDGIRMGQAVGADLANMYNHMAFPGIRIPGRETGEAVFPRGTGFIHVRRDGRRFIDESIPSRHGKSTLGGRLEFNPHGEMWTVLDETVRKAGPFSFTRGQFAGGWLKQVDRYDWSEDNLAEIENGWIVRADTVRELAEKLEIDPDGLETEVARYNSFAAAGEDAAFGRAGAAMAPIETPPFYGYKWGYLLINTMGGLRKDGQARVLDVEGRAIPGLYCAGEIASTYTWALGGGQSIGDALAFGRIAGRVAAREPATVAEAVA